MSAAKHWIKLGFTLILALGLGTPSAFSETEARLAVLESASTKRNQVLVTVALYDWKEHPQAFGLSLSAQIIELFQTYGPDAIDFLFLEYARRGLQAKDLQEAFQLKEDRALHELKVTAHPNSKFAIDYQNSRFQNMNLPLRLTLVSDPTALDPMASPSKDAKAFHRWKLGRYFVGPAVASLGIVSGQVPLGVANASTLALQAGIEYQFGHPKIDSKWWAPFFRKTGLVGLHIVNWAIPVGLYECLRGICQAAGEDPASYFPNAELLNRPTAYLLFAANSVFFSFAQGRFLQDRALLRDSGRINEHDRYIGLSKMNIAANAFRAASIFIPITIGSVPLVLQNGIPITIGEAGLIGLAAAFTLPQFLRTVIYPKIRQIQIRRDMQTLPSGPVGLAQRLSEMRDALCVATLGSLGQRKMIFRRKV